MKVFACFAAFAVPIVHSDDGNLVLLQRRAEAKTAADPSEMAHEVEARMVQLAETSDACSSVKSGAEKCYRYGDGLTCYWTEGECKPNPCGSLTTATKCRAQAEDPDCNWKGSSDTDDYKKDKCVPAPKSSLWQHRAEAKIAADPSELGHEVKARMVVDSRSDMQFVDTSMCFPTPGYIESIRFYPGRAGTLRFRVYRPAGDNFEMVSGTGPVEIPEADTVTDYTLPEPVGFIAGDCMGWAHKWKGTMDFDIMNEADGSEVRWTEGVGDDDKGKTFEFRHSGFRSYSYSVRYKPRVKPYGQCSGDEMCVSSSTSSRIVCGAGQCRGQARKGEKCRSKSYSGANHKGEYVCKTGLVCKGYVDGKIWGACQT